jgi:hypothetical protein
MHTMGPKNHHDEPIRQEILRYIKALDDGDADTLFVLLEAAEVDPELDRLIAEVNQEVSEEAKLGSLSADAEQVRQLLRTHLPSGYAALSDIPPLTVGEVAARLAASYQLFETDRTAIEALLGSRQALPILINRQSVSQMASRFPTIGSDRFWRRFREEAVTSLIGRAHEQAQLVAAREARTRALHETNMHLTTPRPAIVPESQNITTAVRQVFAASDQPDAFSRPGIVPLDNLVTSYPLRVATVPDLNWQRAAQFLSAQTGHAITLSYNDRKRLSGFIYCALHAGTLNGVILINQSDPTVRQRFSIAHELGHYVLHFLPLLEGGQLGLQPGLTMTEGLIYAGEREEELPSGKVIVDAPAIPELSPHAEDEANEFAANLIMPEPAVRSAAAKQRELLGTHLLARRLASTFLVSREAMRRRLIDLNLTESSGRKGTAR